MVEKSKIKAKIKQAYSQAMEYPDFLDTFRPAIQRIIDEYVPSEVTQPWHVNADIDYLAKRSKENEYNTAQFLQLIVNYINMIIQAVERGDRDPLKHLDQTEMFKNDS